jgi:type IV secretory pathway VirJ component
VVPAAIADRRDAARRLPLERSTASTPSAASNGVGDLPLAQSSSQPQTQRKAFPARDAFAIIYSGDGGWRDLDRSLAGVLASKGMNVVGVDVLRYYWKQKSPVVAASDLARIMRYYQQRWHQQKVVLIGFSFGADVLPFLVSRLPAELAADVSLLSLLSPERSYRIRSRDHRLARRAQQLGHADRAGIAEAVKVSSAVHLRAR